MSLRIDSCNITLRRESAYIISRFMEDVNTRQRVSFSFLELQYSLKEFNSRKICQQLGTSLPRSRFLDVTQRSRDGIDAINLEAARIHFSLSDVFVAVAVVVA